MQISCNYVSAPRPPKLNRLFWRRFSAFRAQFLVAGHAAHFDEVTIHAFGVFLQIEEVPVSDRRVVSQFGLLGQSHPPHVEVIKANSPQHEGPAHGDAGLSEILLKNGFLVLRKSTYECDASHFIPIFILDKEKHFVCDVLCAVSQYIIVIISPFRLQ